jgi:hypothetical protein
MLDNFVPSIAVDSMFAISRSESVRSKVPTTALIGTRSCLACAGFRSWIQPLLLGLAHATQQTALEATDVNAQQTLFPIRVGSEFSALIARETHNFPTWYTISHACLGLGQFLI